MTAAATPLRAKEQPKDPSNEIVSAPPSAAAIASLPSIIPETISEVPEKLPEFDDDDHARGLLIRKTVVLTVQAAVFGVGKLASETYDKMLNEKKGVNGRKSIYDLWLRTYMPVIERKIIDRWRRSFEFFNPLFQELETPCLDCIERFDLMALYTLSEPQVTDDDRRSALDLARRGTRISAALARNLGRPPEKRNAARHKRTIKLPAGNVTLTINHPDFRQALEEALTLI